jgi:thiol:disulfide interchange protein/DsbC/DsbD-like thiol-disulfide interchange protein
MFHKSFVFILGLFFGITGIAFAQNSLQSALAGKSASSVVTTPHLRAELMVYAPDGVEAGKPLFAGLQIQHQPQWHTYWKNPGDSGLPTQLTWKLPAGIDAGEIDWPTPKKIPVANLANFGYEGTVFLPVPLTVANTFQSTANEITITLKAQWLVCKTECIPEEGEFALKLPVRGSNAINRTLFDNAKSAAPKLHSGAASFAPSDKQIKLSVAGLPVNWQGKVLEAFPEDGEIIEPSAKVEQNWDAKQKGAWTGAIVMSAFRSKDPSQMVWLLKIAGGQSNPAVRVQAKLDGAWPASAAAKPIPVSPALNAALGGNKVSASAPASSISTAPAVMQTSWMSGTYWFAILGALIGGLILNLMPCVLPVLAIKLLSFAPKKVLDSKSSVAMVKLDSAGAAKVQSDDTLSFRASSGLFAVGVIGSFVLLGGVLLALRGAGQSFGWGFQLQSPSMVIALAVLFMLIGLNLFDAFDVRFLLPSSVANFQSKNPSIEALASGALAVLIATPCTAPFMGASLGLAITLPTTQALLIFAALGLGMALPFILMALVPSIGEWLLRVLPKPGSWMSTLRYVLAWPVFATVLWLLWVYGQQTSVNSVFAVMLSFLLATALLRSMLLRASTFKWVIHIIFGACLLASFWLWNNAPSQNASLQSAASAQAWQDWSAQKQQDAKTAGRPVFVDFTAAWCITCQVNKSTTLNSSEVEAAFKAKNVLLLRADWTSPNAAIATELAKLGRSGLPVYAFYLPGSTSPRLLPEVLTKAIILNALAVL